MNCFKKIIVNLFNNYDMKKIKCILLTLIIASFTRAQAEDGTFNLSVSSDGNLIIQSVQLINADGYEKTIMKEGKQFVFSNMVKRYGVYSLSVSYVNAASKKASGLNVQLFLKAGDTKLVFYGNAGKYRITGASATGQKEFEALVSKDQVYLKRVMMFETRLRQYQESENAKEAAQMKDSISKAESARKEQVFESYVLQHPNEDLSLYAMKIYSSINIENPQEVKSLLSRLGKELQDTEEMIELRKEAEDNERFMSGAKAPDFTQADTSGTVVTLSSFHGKYVLVDFWASWCKPCRAQNPSLVRLYQKYKNKGFTILGVSLDSKKESWLKAIHDDKLEWSHVSDLKSWGNAVAKQYKISHVPQNYLLDSQGVIVGKNLSEEDLEQMLEKELVNSK